MLSHNTVHPIFKFNFGVRKLLNHQLLESKLNENSGATARTGLPSTNVTKKSAVGINFTTITMPTRLFLIEL